MKFVTSNYVVHDGVHGPRHTCKVTISGLNGQ